MKTIKITINHTTFLQKRSFLNSKVCIIILLLFIILSNIITKYYIMLSKFNIEYLKFWIMFRICYLPSVTNNNIKHHATILNQNIGILRKTK